MTLSSLGQSMDHRDITPPTPSRERGKALEIGIN